MRRQPHIGTAEEYASYFVHEPLLDYERAMLIAHVKAGTLTMSEIAHAAGWQSFRAGNRRYGELAAKIRAYLSLPARVGSNGKVIHAYALFDGVGENGDREALLRVHDEVVEGARRAGLVA